MLARHQAIDPDLARRLTAIAAPRNRIAHGYGSIDVERLWRETPAGVETLRAFAAAIAEYLGNQPDEPTVR